MRLEMFRGHRLAAFAFALAAAAAARAEVVDVGENGFLVRETVTVDADATKAWSALVDVGKWWDPAHTWSNDSANLSLDPKPGGCWCEKLPGGGVEHMRVVFSDAGRILRLSGGLGPLQGLAVSGTMTWTLKPAPKGTIVEMTYSAGGYNRGGFREIAPGVEKVLAEQIGRFQRYAGTGKP